MLTLAGNTARNSATAASAPSSPGARHQQQRADDHLGDPGGVGVEPRDRRAVRPERSCRTAWAPRSAATPMPMSIAPIRDARRWRWRSAAVRLGARSWLHNARAATLTGIDDGVSWPKVGCGAGWPRSTQNLTARPDTALVDYPAHPRASSSARRSASPAGSSTRWRRCSPRCSSSTSTATATATSRRPNADDPLSFLDCLYYATVSLSTTGYGDITPFTPSARLVNVLVITPLRVAFLIVLVGTTVETLTTQSRQALKIQRWRNSVRNHTVVVGYGTKGRTAVAAMVGDGVAPADIVVVDTDHAVARARQERRAGHRARRRHQVRRAAAGRRPAREGDHRRHQQRRRPPCWSP